MCPPQNKGSLQFEDKWDLMRPIVLKLLRQESVTKQQWFDLFSYVSPQLVGVDHTPPPWPLTALMCPQRRPRRVPVGR